MAHFQFLEKGRVQSFQKAAELCVLTGELWLTVEGDSKDYVLKKGQTFALSAELLVVIEALQATNLVISDSHLTLPEEPPNLAGNPKSLPQISAVP